MLADRDGRGMLADRDNLKSRLQHIKVQFNERDEESVLTFYLCDPGFVARNTDLATALRQQLDVLSAVQCIGPQGEPDHALSKVVLVNWRLSWEVMQELEHLPRCANVLDLSACEWPPLADSAYEALTRCHVPDWYTHLSLGVTEECDGRLESIIAGITKRRMGDGDAMSDGSEGAAGSEFRERPGYKYAEEGVTITVQSEALAERMQGRHEGVYVYHAPHDEMEE